MNNIEALRLISICQEDIKKIEHFREAFGSTNKMMEPMTKYIVIRCSGTIEQCVKTIIFDYFGSKPIQAKNFIYENFRKPALNIKFDRITGCLKHFDEEWEKEFKNKTKNLNNLREIKQSISDLLTARNKVAHGNDCTMSFDNANKSFKDACKILKLLDEVISETNTP